jgi:putative pyruvate formate lyase activating enzyme
MGAEWTEADLVRELIRLREAGCHNWNLVSPTPWLPVILPALERARAGGRIPVVYNTSGYERPEIVSALGGAVEVYLTDLRYARAETAEEASDARDYVAVSRTALKAMWREAGPLELDAAGIARRGTICRILILPGHAGEAVESLEWVAREIGTGLAISLMAQYTPAYRARAMPIWNRGITMREYRTVTEAMEALGFSLGWVQEFGGPPPDGLLGHTMPAGPAASAATVSGGE